MLNSFRQLYDRIAIPHLTVVLTIGSATSYIIGSFYPAFLEAISFSAWHSVNGQPWRILTFLFYPFSMDMIFAFFAYYVFYFLGTTLESEWGQARYTHYILISWVSAIASSFLFPTHVATNEYLYTSVFLAFAFLYPDYPFYLFFVIPVKVKYLAGITWIFFIVTLIFEPVPEKILATVAVVNFFIFFSKDIFQMIRGNYRHQSRLRAKAKEEEKPFHTCMVCFVTERKDPLIDFRVCLQCKDSKEYCPEHLKNHTHQ